MHVLRPQFRIEESRALAFAADRGFGAIVAADERGPRASHVPFVIQQRDDRVIVQIHLTARNPLVELADGNRRFLLIVSGDDAYISNDWYASRDNVSTWLYEAVHLSGPVRVVPGDHTRGHTERLANTFEKWLVPKPEWKLDTVADKRREMLLKAIVAVEMTVESIEGSFKLNQQKSEADYAAVANGLAALPDHGSQTIAQLMREMRPQAFAATTNEAASLEGSM
jgi:transcriptional regulator